MIVFVKLCSLSFEPNEKLTIINCIKEYISCTDLFKENLEGTPQQLILSYAYSHRPVNSQIIAWYIKLFLGMYGIDSTVYLLHTLLKVLYVYQQQITWGCLSRTFKNQQGDFF